MKIVYVINAIKQSGPNQVLLNILYGLQRKHSVIVISFLENDKQEIKKINETGALTINLSVPKLKIPSIGAKKLKKVLEEIEPDIVHSHGILSDIATIRSGYGNKSVTTVHNDPFKDYLYSFGIFRGSIYLISHIFYLRKFKKVICCSKHSHKKLSPIIHNTTYIHNGIKSIKKHKKNIKLLKENNIPAGSRIFIYAGKLNKRKNVIKLIDNFKIAKQENDYLIILGNGDLMKKAKAISDDHIKILGNVKDVQSYLSLSNIYISLSHSEGFSISILEAMQENLFLFLSDIPSHREIFESSNSTNIGMLTNNKTFLEDFKKINIKNVESHNVYKHLFTDIKMSSQYETIYKLVAKS